MLILVNLVGLIIVIEGAIFLISPKKMKNLIAFLQKDKRIGLGGAISIVIGVVFLMAASSCQLPIVMFIMGILSLVKGIYILTSKEKVKS